MRRNTLGISQGAASIVALAATAIIVAIALSAQLPNLYFVQAAGSQEAGKAEKLAGVRLSLVAVLEDGTAIIANDGPDPVTIDKLYTPSGVTSLTSPVTVQPGQKISINLGSQPDALAAGLPDGRKVVLKEKPGVARLETALVIVRTSTTTSLNTAGITPNPLVHNLRDNNTAQRNNGNDDYHSNSNPIHIHSDTLLYYSSLLLNLHNPTNNNHRNHNSHRNSNSNKHTPRNHHNNDTVSRHGAETSKELWCFNRSSRGRSSGRNHRSILHGHSHASTKNAYGRILRRREGFPSRERHSGQAQHSIPFPASPRSKQRRNNTNQNNQGIHRFGLVSSRHHNKPGGEADAPNSSRSRTEGCGGSRGLGSSSPPDRGKYRWLV
jgi:hypothetical protein